MGLKKIIRMFDKGNVCVTGLRGDGKDMLMANVVARRKKPYVSNVDYGGKRFDFVPSKLDCGGNIYKNFIEGDVKHYEFPYPDHTDVYVSDAGVYFPAQYCSELNRSYGYIATFMALSRHLGQSNMHVNAQNLNRVYDKIREQSDMYIRCRCCFVFFGNVVIQKITTYDKYQSCVDRVPAFWLRRPLLNANRLQLWQIQKQNYEISHGCIKNHWLIYVNKSNYDTRRFKEMLKNGKKENH